MKKIFGLFGGEKAVVLTASERLEIISNKAQDAVDFGPDYAGESEFVIGTDGYDVEEISQEEMNHRLEASKLAGVISSIEDPTMVLEDNTVAVEINRDAPWGTVSDKGRISGAG